MVQSLLHRLRTCLLEPRPLSLRLPRALHGISSWTLTLKDATGKLLWSHDTVHLSVSDPVDGVLHLLRVIQLGHFLVVGLMDCLRTSLNVRIKGIWRNEATALAVVASKGVFIALITAYRQSFGVTWLLATNDLVNRGLSIWTSLSEPSHQIFLDLHVLGINSSSVVGFPIHVSCNICSLLHRIPKVPDWTLLIRAQGAAEDTVTRETHIILVSQPTIIFENIAITTTAIALIIEC